MRERDLDRLALGQPSELLALAGRRRDDDERQDESES
jgi:hypothetical protein